MSAQSTGFLIAIAAALLAGCSDDPYDPMLGPRNPRPGAERFLSAKSDLSEPEKQCLLAVTQCPADTLEKLFDAPSREVRSLVAANPSVTPAILEKLMGDKEPGVRQYVASNAKTPTHILLRLQADREENVRWQVANRREKQP